MNVKLKIQQVMEKLQNSLESPINEKVTMGFDGFVDSIVRVVRNMDDKNQYSYFGDIPEFGAYISEKAGKSCFIEMDEQLVKIGGNMPITANALGRTGVKVNCIGAMGWPEISDAFSSMSPNCTVYTVAKPGYCTALEFNDGKILLASNNGINSMSWDGIKKAVGLDTLKDFFSTSKIMGMFNWSEIVSVTSIWQGIIHEVLPSVSPCKDNIMYFDLSDCSRRNDEDIKLAFSLMKHFSKYYKVILSLNENETGCIHNVFFGEKNTNEPENMGKRIYSHSGIDCLILHAHKFSMAWEGEKSYHVNNFYVKEPVLSTGGGDNFNAGVCLGQLLGLDLEASLVLGGSVGSFYVRHGYSPDINQLIKALAGWNDDINI